MSMEAYLTEDGLINENAARLFRLLLDHESWPVFQAFVQNLIDRETATSRDLWISPASVMVHPSSLTHKDARSKGLVTGAKLVMDLPQAMLQYQTEKKKVDKLSLNEDTHNERSESDSGS